MINRYKRLSVAVLTIATLFQSPYAFAADDSQAKKADGEAVSEQSCSVESMKQKFESKGSGDYLADNKLGYIGRYQMGAEALEDMGYIKKGASKFANGKVNFKATYDPSNWTGKDGINSAADWKNNGALQDAVEPLWQAKQMSYMPKNVKNAMGGQIPGGCGPMTDAAYKMGAQLVGGGGVSDFLASGGFCGKKGQTSPSGYTLKYSTMDGFDTCVQKYMCAGASCSTVNKDMSKKTCGPTMQMINGISCGNFSGAQAAFCQQAKPFLMTDGECNSAEAMAEKEPKGPNKEKCENLTFGPGTGSWSFALACSWAKEVVADQDGMNNNIQQPTGPVNDPACISNLQAMGVQFETKGRVFNGNYGGETCYIENAVSLSGTALPFGKSITMACNTALAMEKMGTQLKGMGVTGYTDDIYAIRKCGPMIDDRGSISGTITHHSYGWAVDFGGFIYNGQAVSMAQVRNPSAPYYAIANQVKAAACNNFKLVLSPTYANYKKFGHNHVEWGNQSKSRCR